MKIPNKIKVSGHVYTVEFTKHKSEERGRGNWGKTMNEDKRILIDSEIPDSQKEETFLHELLHVCMHTSRVAYDLDDKIYLSEEQIVMRLTEPSHRSKPRIRPRDGQAQDIRVCAWKSPHEQH